MASPDLSIVTGALSYSGKHIARKLLAAGQRVKTITGHPNRPNPFGDKVEVAPFSFEDPGGLTDTLRGASTLYNTYWIRFPMRGMTYERAAENSKTLVRCAEEAGVQRIVHISIVRPSKDAPYGYYRGKAEVEAAIQASSLSYAILRPTVLFGGEDILLNNIAWSLRRFPVFPIAGKGDYKIRPINVDDLAQLAVEQGQHAENVILDAVGPETYTFRELARTIAQTIGAGTLFIPVPRLFMLLGARMIGLAVRDVLLTRDEINGLMDGLMSSDEPATGTTKISDWLQQNWDLVGTVYASELRRR
ncbi:MAG: epimerase [Armatimonadetes bacterium]|nr:epimerase [Armatimonadota bacterium]